MIESNKVLFIINRHSGTGYRASLEDKILSNCKKRNLDCSFEFTQEPGHAKALARMAVDKKFKMVFAVGGDGTVNEVAQGLLYSSIPLGIIPKGSGNGLARHLKIPLKVEKALKLLNLVKTVSIDTFTINNRLSLNVSGIGFDGHVAALFGRDGKRGLFSYGKLVVSHFVRFKKFECELVLDGVRTTQMPFIISCANSSQFGNNATIAPQASVCDQELDICLVKKMTVFQALFFVRRLFNGTSNQSRHMSIHRASEINLITKPEVPYHVDGEAAGTATHFSIKVNPSSLLVIVPEHNISI